MNFQHRSFVGNNSALPRPEIYFNSDERLLIVATPWGPQIGAKKAVETVRDYFLATKDDSEVTSPFRRLEYLSGTANNLRIAVMLANELLYREENKDEYKVGVELFASCLHERELSWVRAGQPNIIFSRPGTPALPLQVTLTLNKELGGAYEQMAPLPSHLLGLSPEANLQFQSISPQNEDSLILLSSSWLSPSLLNVTEANNTFESISRIISKESQEPHWFGLLKL